MRHTGWLFVAEVVTVQPLVHAGAPPFINQLNDSVHGRKKVICQMADKFSCLRFAEMTVRAAIFGLEFFVIEPVMQMTANRCFINKLRLGDRGGSPVISGEKDTSNSVTHTAISTAVVQHFQRYPLLRSQMYFHVDQLDHHHEQNQASSLIAGIEPTNLK
jgi:hypothetical protein